MRGGPEPVDSAGVDAAVARVPADDSVDHIAETCRLLADPVRTKIFYALADGAEMCVGDISIAVGASESAVSHALRLLRSAGVVSNRRSGRLIYYTLNSDLVPQLLKVFARTGRS